MIKRLSELSDYYIDNCGPIGDALVTINNNLKVSAFSTISGSFILNSILSEVADLAKDEDPFPFYVSANIPNAKNNNNQLKFKLFTNQISSFENNQHQKKCRMPDHSKDCSRMLSTGTVSI